MLFERFLKKRDPARADPAAGSQMSPPSQEALAELALHHADAAARHAAARQLDDPGLLRRIMENPGDGDGDGDGDAVLREIATARYRQLLGSDPLPQSMAGVWRAEIAGIADLRLLGDLARQAAHPELRHAAIERIQDPEILAACALHDSRAANRRRAIERLENRAALEQVARQIGKRDKQVYRLAREKLRQLHEQEALPPRVRAQREAICDRIARLGRVGHWAPEQALLAHLEQQWSALELPPDADLQARWECERQRFLDGYARWRDAQAAQSAARDQQTALRSDYAALLDELALAATLDDERTLRALCDRVTAAWAALPPLPADQRQALESRRDALLAAAEQVRRNLTGQQRHLERLRRIGERMQRLLDESRPLDQRQGLALLEEGRTLAAALAETEEAAGVQTRAERLEQRLRQQQRHAEQRLRQLAERLTELETLLAEGALRKADPLYQSLQAALELIQASDLPRAASAGYAARLHALAPRLRELQHWRRWGADQHREGLCADMETLAAPELPPELLAERLHALRADWKALDHSGSSVNQALWERFQAAAERVHARCRPFLEAQAAEREANRLARERVCQELERFLERVDWERVDWKKTLHAERTLRHTWSLIGPVDGRQRKSLERRFHQALKRLDRHLDAERKSNQAARRNLIEQVRALADWPELDQAIERTKLLQREWRTTVPGRHKDENRMWQEFRAACDAVFERRAAQSQLHASALREHLAQREALCDALLNAAASESDPVRLAAALRGLEARWRETQELPIPRQAAAALNQRWQAGCDQLEQRLREAGGRQRRRWLDQLARQAEFCARLERQALGAVPPEPPDPDSLQQQWQALGFPDDQPTPLAPRYAAALAALTDPAGQSELRARIAANDARRQRLCLQLEILAGVDSPPALAQQRLEIQVARLVEHMSEGEQDPLRGADQLLADWHACGPATPDPELEARFVRAGAVLVPHSADFAAGARP